MPTPLISEDLINYLAANFPDVAFGIDDINLTDRELWFRVGQISVVRHLQRVMEDQQENILAN